MQYLFVLNDGANSFSFNAISGLFDEVDNESGLYSLENEYIVLPITFK